MYIDAKKFDYSEFNHPDAERLVERDKEFARDSYRKWIEDNADDIVERQWEIDDIGAVEQAGEFVKLLKEAEFTYALGAYTSAIALVGICAEDLCRFFASSAGHNLDSASQYERVNRLLEIGAITQEVAGKFHAVRGLRNDCLHYNDEFKQRETSALKADALEALNTIKAVYAEIVGAVDYRNVDLSRFSAMVDAIASEAAGAVPGDLGADAALSRTRNVFASVFGIDLSLGESGRPAYSTSIFTVLEIDTGFGQPELALQDMTTPGLLVIVDLTESEAAAIGNAGIQEGDVVAASLMCVPNKLDLSDRWRIWSPVRKLA
jgi:hypothetical protein